MDRRVKAASVSVASNTGLLAIKLTVGIITGSVSIISAAVDSFNDLAASLIALFSVRASAAPADAEHPYGHGKVENISGAVQALLIFAAALYIIYESVSKILTPEPIEALGLGMAVMAATAAVNVFVSRYLLAVADETESPAIRADAYHLTTDVWTSLGVLAALALVWYTGVQLWDPIVALAVAAAVIRVAYLLMRDATNVLVDMRLPEDEVRELERIVMQSPGIIGYHKMRTRKSGTHREIDYHLLVPASMPVLDAHRLAQSIEDKMRRKFPRVTVVTHIEPDTVEMLAQPDTEIKRRPPPRRVRRRRQRG